MAATLEVLQTAVAWAGMILAGLLCVVGLGLSCLAISGTWLVVAAAILAALVRDDPFPGIWTIVIFAAISAAVELAEALAGGWGVRKRGGSGLATFVGVVGGLLGLIVGSFIPVPVVGSLLGMIVVSFALVFAVESLRLKQAGQAANIAWGTVIARVVVSLLKILVTLGLSAWLWIGVAAF